MVTFAVDSVIPKSIRCRQVERIEDGLMEPVPLKAEEPSVPPLTDLPESVPESLFSFQGDKVDVEQGFSLTVHTAVPLANVQSMLTSKKDLDHLLPRRQRDFLDTASTNFYGIKGTGESFVFIIDSSLSMRGDLRKAKTQLQQTLMCLTPKHKFLVIFYDKELRFRLNDSAKPITAALCATKDHLEANAAWMTSVEPREGGAPLDALSIALGSRCDVIYLLTDGRFSPEIPVRVRQKNWRTDGFGERVMRSIIHTIGFGAADTYAPLRRIAEENGGIFVPVK